MHGGIWFPYFLCVAYGHWSSCTILNDLYDCNTCKFAAVFERNRLKINRCHLVTYSPIQRCNNFINQVVTSLQSHARCGSWPFSARWLLGGRLLGGCGFQRNKPRGPSRQDGVRALPLVRVLARRFWRPVISGYAYRWTMIWLLLPSQAPVGVCIWQPSRSKPAPCSESSLV